MAQILYNDVPKELVDLLKMIDFSKIPANVQAEKLAELKLHADKHLKPRTAVSDSGPSKLTIPADIPQAALDIVNLYDYSGFGIVKRATLKALFGKWLRTESGLPLR